MSTGVMWFRRDLRLHDHPALVEAAQHHNKVAALFVLEPTLLNTAGEVRTACLLRSLHALNESMSGNLIVRIGKAEEIVPQVMRELKATTVYATIDCAPYGRSRDRAVRDRLAHTDPQWRFARIESPYAIAPGSISNNSGKPYQVFTPFRRAWLDHGWPATLTLPKTLRWIHHSESEALPSEPDVSAVELPELSEEAAHVRWREFFEDDLEHYEQQRDLPAEAGTSDLSTYLKWGQIHPRTLLADLAQRKGQSVETFRSELCWREFYADVLWHRPDTRSQYYHAKYSQMRYADPAHDDQAAAHLHAWQTGRTGYPMVDAGMRQLLAQGWIHNRVRMIVASFLVKDLHIEWQHGARWFMQHLRDGDMASNSHNWQWAAGCGTDAAPYFRIFNPVSQGLAYDPDGRYVRRFIPELAHLAGKSAHEPWKHPGGHADGYPTPIVDHAQERAESLRRLSEINARS